MMSYHIELQTQIELFKQNKLECASIPYDIKNHNLSLPAKDALVDEFEEYYTKNCNEHLSKEIIFEMIRNAFMIDYYQNIKEF